MTQGKSLVEDMARAMACAHWDHSCSANSTPNYTRGEYWEHWVKHAEAALSVLKDRLPADDRELVERLQLQAQRASDIARQMAQAKSLRQEGHDPPRDDLYMWPTPEQTIEGKAADRIIAYRASRDET